MTSLTSSSYKCNIIQLTKGGLVGQHGDRTPSVFLFPWSDRLYFASSINYDQNYFLPSAKEIVVNVPTHIEIHQRYTSGGKYRYFIKINGEEAYSIINTDARQFYNVKVYASNPWEDNCSGYIKNFEVTNFL